MKKFICIVSLIYFASLSVEAQEIVPSDSSKIKVLEYPTSLNDMINQFRGKVIYIDVMASWCTPCIGELIESKKLDSFFEENDIVKIYVTIDQNEDLERCVALLNKHSAKGYFVSYLPPQDITTTFPSDIEKLFLQNEQGELDISIPKYAIVDKEGSIVVKRAERPSKRDALIEQLEEWIDK